MQVICPIRCAIAPALMDELLKQVTLKEIASYRRALLSEVSRRGKSITTTSGQAGANRGQGGCFLGTEMLFGLMKKNLGRACCADSITLSHAVFLGPLAYNIL